MPWVSAKRPSRRDMILSETFLTWVAMISGTIPTPKKAAHVRMLRMSSGFIDGAIEGFELGRDNRSLVTRSNHRRFLDATRAKANCYRSGYSGFFSWDLNSSFTRALSNTS